MAHYDLEEQEQIDSIKTWWKMYGNLVTSVVTVACLAVIGWQAWNWYQRGQSTQAAAIYSVLEQAVSARDAQKIKAAAGELAEKYGSTNYAVLGALLAGKQSFDASDLKTAKVQLSWAADNGKDELKDIARLRLAAVLLDEQAYDGDEIPLVELEIHVRQRALFGDRAGIKRLGDVVDIQHDALSHGSRPPSF